MFTIISRILHYGFKNFWRNGWLSTTTVAIMVLSLLVFSGLIMFGITTNRAATSIEDKIDISVYFKTNTPEDQILNIKQSLESLSEVKAVNYVSSDQALEIFKTTHKDDSVISQAINELNTNPLEASLNIKAQQPEQYATIADYLTAPNLNTYVDSVSYSKNQDVIQRLTAIVNNVNRGGLALVLFLAIVAGPVFLFTTLLATYSYLP